MGVKEATLKELLGIVERIERDLASLKEQITQLLNMPQPKKVGKQKAPQQATRSLPSPEEMRKIWKQLQKEYEQRNYEAISEFVNNHTKSFLKAFAAANNLPVNPKGPKKEIEEQLIQLLKVGEAISRPPGFTRPPRYKQNSQASPLMPNEEGETDEKSV